MLRKNNKIYLIVILIIAVSIGALYFLTQGSGDNEKITLNNTISPNDWTKGNKSAELSLIEYADFQCPACQQYAPIVDAVVNEFNDHMVFAYRHFPLNSIHANADAAARAAEAAGKQGKFWEMHDKIYENQSIWANSTDGDNIFAGYAEELGLDKAKFITDYNDGAVKDRVNAGLQSALDNGLNSTPSFFLNGERINNPRNLEAFRALIRDAVKAQTNE